MAHFTSRLVDQLRGVHAGRRRPEPAVRNAPEASVPDFLGSVSVFAYVVRTMVDQALDEVSGETALTIGQLRIMDFMAHTGHATLSDIAQYLAVSNAAASKTVDRLVDAGFIRRQRRKTDRRKIRVDLTKAGIDVLRRFRTRVHDTVESHLEEQEPSRLAGMVATMDRMTRALLRVAPDHAPACRGCIACNLFRRDGCPLGEDGPHAACKPLGERTRPSVASAPFTEDDQAGT